MTKAIEAAARAMADFNSDYEGPELQWQAYAEDFRVGLPAYLAAMEAEGFVMVPVEATDKICEAGLFANDNALLMGADCTDMRNAYRAMIAAATTHDDGGE